MQNAVIVSEAVKMADFWNPLSSVDEMKSLSGSSEI